MLTDKTLLAGLREWAGSASSHRLSDYEAWARDQEAASPSTLINRFGSWGAAMSEAGLERYTTKRQSRRVISDAEIWASVVAYLRADRPSHSFADLGTWLREQDGLPSAASVRSRLGKWSVVRDTAQRVLEYVPGVSEPWAFADEIVSITPGEGPRRDFTDAACFAALTRVADAVPGNLTMVTYDELRAADAPSSSFVLRRFGSWRSALEGAGLADRAN